MREKVPPRRDGGPGKAQVWDAEVQAPRKPPGGRAQRPARAAGLLPDQKYTSPDYLGVWCFFFLIKDPQPNTFSSDLS